MEGSFAGKVALVTGGSRGIGRAISVALAQKGARVAVNYRANDDAAKETAAEIESLGGICLLARYDITVPGEVERMVEDTEQTFDSVDILVNNAGFNRDNLLVRMSESDWDAVLDTNLKGAFLCTKAVLRSMMRKRWGRIINISSVSGVVGNAGQSNYSAAKAGLIGFTKAVAREVGSRNITANAIAPGLVITELTEHIGEELIQQARRRAAINRLGTPEDIAAAVAFLASDEASYITGQILMVDGGLGL